MGKPMDFSDFIDLLELIDEQHRYGLSSGKQIKLVTPTIDMVDATVTGIHFTTSSPISFSTLNHRDEDVAVSVMNWLESKEMS